MKHYRQIIINVEVDDDLSEAKMDSLIAKVYETIEENTDENEIKIDHVRVNQLVKMMNEVYVYGAICEYPLSGMCSYIYKR